MHNMHDNMQNNMYVISKIICTVCMACTSGIVTSSTRTGYLVCTGIYIPVHTGMYNNGTDRYIPVRTEYVPE